MSSQFVHGVYIINKSGGLIFSWAATPAARLDTNEALRIASIWHSVSAITKQVSPVPGCHGMEVMHTDACDIYALQPMTGTKMLAVVGRGCAGAQGLLQRVYQLYCDYALKTPFYEMEMPIRCELFDQALSAAVGDFNATGMLS
ncbi:unnamed protein product [Pedinophyceae sp. YPF-701]|nr:unnamed protein product [Pedinophyceae sp. YPF-701]